MNKAFPRFGLGYNAPSQASDSASQAPFPVPTRKDQPTVTRCAFRQAIFLPLLKHERDLLSKITSSLFPLRKTLWPGLFSLLQSQHAQIGSMIYILSQQYELYPEPGPADKAAGGTTPRERPRSQHRPTHLKTQILGDLMNQHQSIIRSIDGLAREFRGTVRDAMVLGHIAQRHREMSATLGTWNRGQHD